MKNEDINDEYFGKLTWVEKTEYEQSNLFGAKYFRPLDLIVQIQINSNYKIVTKEQKQLFHEIEEKYLDLKYEIDLFIHTEIIKYEKKINKRIERVNLEKDLKLILITISEIFDTSTEWSLEYELKNDFAFYTIEFHGWEPFRLGISC